MNVLSSFGQISMTNLGKCMPDVETPTLPLNEGDILHHAKLVSKVYKLLPRQRFGENVHNFIICGYVLELYCSLLYHVSDEVIFDLNVRRPVMKYRIVQKLDTTLIITMYQGRLYLLIK
jgi:hypothetical protein